MGQEDTWERLARKNTHIYSPEIKAREAYCGKNRKQTQVASYGTYYN